MSQTATAMTVTAHLPTLEKRSTPTPDTSQHLSLLSLPASVELLLLCDRWQRFAMVCKETSADAASGRLR